MISVFRANTLTVDLLCIVDSINKMKREKPELWVRIVEEFKRLADKSDDEYEYSIMKEFITNLQDLY